MLKRKLKCEICDENPSKYTCPKCEIRTCNIECCNKHKLKFDCNGKYDFVKINSRFEIDILKLKSDFTFLESIDREIDDFEKLLAPGRKLEGRFSILSKACISRNINLIFIPGEMSRHQVNKSFYFTKERKFYWTLELLYNNQSFILHQVDDSKTFGNIWGNDIKNAIMESQTEPFYELIKSRNSLQFSILNKYNCSQIMKNPNTKDTTTDSMKLITQDCVQIYSTEKLQNVLCGLTFIEFPTIVISHTNK